jgi:hypothetical protein
VEVDGLAHPRRCLGAGPVGGEVAIQQRASLDRREDKGVRGRRDVLVEMRPEDVDGAGRDDDASMRSWCLRRAEGGADARSNASARSTRMVECLRSMCERHSAVSSLYRSPDVAASQMSALNFGSIASASRATSSKVGTGRA